MTRSKDEKPDTWADWGNHEIHDAGGDIYYSIIADGVVKGGKATNVWVWHWHTPIPKDLEPSERWQLSGCGNHTVEQVEPLTLSPSLACENGCPSHGYLKEGRWHPA